MILNSPHIKPNPRFFFLEEYYEEEYWDEDYEEESWIEVFRAHIPVSLLTAACGYTVAESEFYKWTRFLQLPPESERCVECWRINSEHRGSVPPQDATYRPEVGARFGRGRRNPYIKDYPGFTSVGVAEGGELYLASNQRTQWDSLSTAEQRQASLSAENLRRRPGGGRPILRIARLAGAAGGGILLGTDLTGT